MQEQKLNTKDYKKQALGGEGHKCIGYNSNTPGPALRLGQESQAPLMTTSTPQLPGGVQSEVTIPWKPHGCPPHGFLPPRGMALSTDPEIGQTIAMPPVPLKEIPLLPRAVVLNLGLLRCF